MYHPANKVYRQKTRIWGFRNRRNAFCKQVTKNPYLPSLRTRQNDSKNPPQPKPVILYGKNGKMVLLPDGTYVVVGDSKSTDAYIGKVSKESLQDTGVLAQSK